MNDLAGIRGQAVDTIPQQRRKRLRDIVFSARQRTGDLQGQQWITGAFLENPLAVHLRHRSLDEVADLCRAEGGQLDFVQILLLTQARQDAAEMRIIRQFAFPGGKHEHDTATQAMTNRVV